MFQRFFDEGLAQASFLVGCDRTRKAVVIDPRRDASVHLAAARQLGAEIVAAIETHVHADFVSGARELADIGVRVYTGPGADLEYDHHAVKDGETLQVGDVTLTFLHTPGHTWEHVCVLATAPGEPDRLFSGDLLFVGGVGRPDLLGEAESHALASCLFVSLQRIIALDGRTEVHPGHGAGSLCGAGIGHEPSSTIERERRQNPMLQHRDRDRFVSAVMADIPGTPPYFARMKRVNKAGPALLRELRALRLPSIRPAAAAALAADGAMILDLRTADAFAGAHPYGALNLAYGTKIGYWAGWVVPPDVPLLLLADETAQARDATMQLLRVGLDLVEGMIEGGISAWIGAGLPVAQIDQISAAGLRDAVEHHDSIRIVDVRTEREWRGGHIAGSVNIPVGELPVRAGELHGPWRIATICEGGYRSSLAASLLAHEGIAPLVNVVGGMAAYRALEIA